MTTKRYFEFVEGSSSKFWEIWREGSKVMTRYGKIGADGQTTVKDEGDEGKATKLHDKLIGEKTKKGYAEKGAAKAAGPGVGPSASQLRTRWDALIAELKAHPSVKITKAELTPPMNESQVAKVVKRLGLPLTAELRAFLALCDGMNLSWTTEALGGYAGGMIAIPSLGTLDDPDEWPCGPDALEAPLAAYGVDFEEAQGHVVPFDFFQRTKDEIEIAVMLPRGETLDVFASDDQTACLEDSALLSLGEYLDLVLRSFGSPMARAALQLGSSNTEAKRAAEVIPGILTRAYSLDALIELTRSEPNVGQVAEFFRGPERGKNTPPPSRTPFNFPHELKDLSGLMPVLGGQELAGKLASHAAFVATREDAGWESFRLGNKLTLCVYGQTEKAGEALAAVDELFKSRRPANLTDAQVWRRQVDQQVALLRRWPGQFDGWLQRIEPDKALEGAQLSWANLGNTVCEGVSFRGAQLDHGCAVDSIFDGADFTGAALAGTDFSRSSLRGCVFKGATLKGTDFEKADLTGADFSGADTSAALFPSAVLDDVRY